MLQFAGKVNKHVNDWYEHQITGKDYRVQWHKTWLEPVEEEISFEIAYDILVNFAPDKYMTKENIILMAKHIKECGNEK